MWHIFICGIMIFSKRGNVKNKFSNLVWYQCVYELLPHSFHFTYHKVYPKDNPREMNILPTVTLFLNSTTSSYFFSVLFLMSSYDECTINQQNLLSFSVCKVVRARHVFNFHYNHKCGMRKIHGGVTGYGMNLKVCVNIFIL